MTAPNYFAGNARVNVGRIQVTTLLDGWLSLDGGAMYGVVPKTLWSQKLPADDQNRVRMAMRPLLVRTPSNLVVVESGIGQAVPPELHERYGIDRTGPWLDELVRNAGEDPEKVDTVVCTHLHWDHAGGLCRMIDDAYRPTFPNAQHVFQAGEWQIATNPTNLHKASYAPPSLLPLAEHGLLKLVSGDCEVVPGVRFEFTNGHTENHAVVWLQDSGESGAFLGDLVPTASHVPLAWISAYDINAGGSWRARESLYPKLAQANAKVFYYHEPEFPVGRVIRDGARYRHSGIT